MCRSRNIDNRDTRSRIHEVKKEESTDDSSSDENELFIGEIMKTTGEDVLIANLKVNGKNVNFKIDTGAQCNSAMYYPRKFSIELRRNQRLPLLGQS